MEQPPGGDQPPNEAVGAPTDEPAAKKPRTDEVQSSAGGISHHIENWVHDLESTAPAAAPQASQEDLPAPGGDRPYQDEVMELLGDEKPEANTSQPFEYKTDIKEKLVIPGRRVSTPRRSVSNPFLKSTSKLLESVTDLADVLSHDDCMLLGRYFWVFTLEQLEFLLSDNVNDTDIDEEAAKRVRDEFTARLKALLLGERPDRRGRLVSSNRADYNFNTNRMLVVDAEAIAVAAICGDDADEGLRKDIRTNVSSKAFPWLNSGAHEQPQMAADPMDMKMPPFNTPANLYAPTGSGNILPPPQASPFAAMDTASSEQVQGGLMCAEDMGMKAGDPEVLPNAEQQETDLGADEPGEESKPKAPIKIEDTLSKWKEAIRVYKENSSTVAPNKKFKLDGAIGVLIPGSTMNFLRSVEAETAWDFLSARRQENAPIGKLVREWRKLCSATEVVTQYAISKHLSGVALRMENALENIPPIELTSREWMSDPINGMAGAAREFLIYNQGIRSLGEFLSLKTKNLSIALEAWREKEGMERLKGSGKVAMISSWKAQSREMVELEKFTGKVVDMSECLRELKYKEKLSKSPGKSSVKKRKKSQVPSLEYKPQVVVIDPEISKTLLEETLGKELADALKSHGIKTPEELLKADYTVENSQLYQAIVGGGFVESQEFENKVQELRESVTQAVQKRSRTIPDPDKAHASFNRSIKKRRSTDPFDALSATSQAFLATAGVTTAEQFLSTRSTELASKFGEWREEQGKPALKGCGNIASISGWKNLVRKRAADLGMTELQDLEPERTRRSTGPSSAKPSTSQNRRPPARRKTPKKYVEEPDEIDDDVSVEEDSSDNEAGNESDPGDEPVEIRPRKPLKKPTYVVATVANDFLEKNKGPPLVNLTGKTLADDGLELFAVDSQILSGQFLFDISRRGANNSSSFYLMFHGFNNGEVNFDTTSSFVTCRLDGQGDQDQQFEVLADVPLKLDKSSEDDFSGPFSTLSLGGGLLDVTRFIDREILPPQDISHFKVVLAKFSLGESVPEWPQSDSVELSQNIIFQRTKANTSRALLYFDQPIQRGQTVPIQFPSLTTLMSSKTFDGSRFELYHLIEDSILSLSSTDLASLGNWLLTNISNPATLTSSTIGFDKACEQSVRFAWVGQRVAAVLEQTLGLQDSEDLAKKLSFVNVINFTSGLAPAKQTAYRTIVLKAVKNNLEYAVDLDDEMGFVRRRQWCASARELFDETVDALANFVVNQDGTITNLSKTLLGKFVAQLDEMMSSPKEVVKLAVKPTCTWMGIGKGAKKYVNIIAREPEEGFIVCQDDSETKPVLLPAEEVTKGSATFAMSWYKKYYAEIISAVLDAFTSVSSEYFLSPLTDVDQAQETLKTEAGSPATTFNSKSISFEKFPLILPKSKVDTTPHSLPFFLSLVWPHLRNLGWSMVAGKTPSEIIYSSREQDNTTRLGFEQHRREQQREKQKKAINRMGFGKLDKSTKRVVSKVFVEAEKSDFEAISATTVKGVFDKYEEWLKNCPQVEGTDVDEYNGKVARIIAALDKLFESIAPLLSVRSNRMSSPGTSGRLSESYPSGFLSEFLLVAPNVIRQANLPHKSQVDSLSVIFELTKYYVSHHRDLLKENCHLPREVYRREPSYDSPAFIGTRVNSMIQKDAKKRANNGGDGGIELMPDSFRENLTDFILCVIDNAMPLRASEDDAERKKGRITAGSPGLACKHCKGARFEGRYFFSSVESLTSSYTVMEKHYLKCSSVPQKVKDDLETARANHAMQRRDIPVGSQQAFYRSLWDRLTGSGTPYNEMAGVLMSPDTKNVDAEDSNDVDDADSFDDHIKLIEHIKETVVDEKISEALKQYYSCLEYGGRVYMREDVMPEHFSANWLVSKMVPKDYSVNSYKKTFVG